MCHKTLLEKLFLGSSDQFDNRHSGEACAGLDPVAGIHKDQMPGCRIKACPGLDPGSGMTD